MNWLPFKKKGCAVADIEPARPGSKGSARDPNDVAVEGVEGERKAIENEVDDVKAWQPSPEHGGGEKPLHVGEDVKEEETEVKMSPLKGMNLTNEELTAKLFDSIDKSRDGNIRRDELVPALQVFFQQDIALFQICS